MPKVKGYRIEAAFLPDEVLEAALELALVLREQTDYNDVQVTYTRLRNQIGSLPTFDVRYIETETNDASSGE